MPHQVMDRFPGETSCQLLAWAVMDVVIAGGRGLGLTIANQHAVAALFSRSCRPVDGAAGGPNVRCAGANGVTFSSTVGTRPSGCGADQSQPSLGQISNAKDDPGNKC